jgi:nucleoside-diphosphate-sugar epimerase
MRIFVAGATGVAGWRATRELAKAGHEVTGLARTDEKAAQLERLGAKPVSFDVFDAADVKAHVAGHDVVVNLLTHIPKMAKAALPGVWNENNRLREEVSAHLAAASDGRIIQESITFPYGDHGDEWVDENAEQRDARYLAGVSAAEANALAQEGGVVLRFAQFYSPDSHHTIDQVRFAKRGVVSMPGKADGYWSLIHADDVATAVVAALDAPKGVYNVAEDEPVTRRESAAILAELLGKKKLRHLLSPVPMLNSSQRISNKKFKQATGWAPSVPSQREGWPLILKEMS